MTLLYWHLFDTANPSNSYQVVRRFLSSCCRNSLEQTTGLLRTRRLRQHGVNRTGCCRFRPSRSHSRSKNASGFLFCSCVWDGWWPSVLGIMLEILESFWSVLDGKLARVPKDEHYDWTTAFHCALVAYGTASVWDDWTQQLYITQMYKLQLLSADVFVHAWSWEKPELPGLVVGCAAPGLFCCNPWGGLRASQRGVRLPSAWRYGTLDEFIIFMKSWNNKSSGNDMKRPNNQQKHTKTIFGYFLRTEYSAMNLEEFTAFLEKYAVQEHLDLTAAFQRHAKHSKVGKDFVKFLEENDFYITLRGFSRVFKDILHPFCISIISGIVINEHHCGRMQHCYTLQQHVPQTFPLDAQVSQKALLMLLHEIGAASGCCLGA